MHRCSTIEFTVEQTNGPVQAQVQGSTVYICEASSQSKWWHTHYLHPQIFFSIFVNPPSKLPCQASLVAQWIRIHLPVQGTQVQSLVQEDSTCCRATMPACHNYCVPRVMPCNSRSHHSKNPEHRNSGPRSQLQKACTKQWRPSTAKSK